MTASTGPPVLPLHVRSATLEDADAIAEVHILARRAAYAHFFPPEFLSRLDIAETAAQWRDWLAEPGNQCLAAEIEGRLVGYLLYGRAAEEDGVAEVLHLHVHPGAWRRSVGSSLMSAAVDAMRAAGYREAVLYKYVYKPNQNARRFYERAGWRNTGAGPLAERGGWLIKQVRYRRALT